MGSSDELPEFPRRVVKFTPAIRGWKIDNFTSCGTVNLPAQSMLVAAMNPCPCGYLGHLRACSDSQDAASLPSILALDRIDIHLEVPAHLGEPASAESIENDTRAPERIAVSRELMLQRQGCANAHLREC